MQMLSKLLAKSQALSRSYTTVAPTSPQAQAGEAKDCFPRKQASSALTTRHLFLRTPGETDVTPLSTKTVPLGNQEECREQCDKQARASAYPSVPLPSPGTATGSESGCLHHPRHHCWFPTDSSQNNNLAMSGQFQSHSFCALCNLLILQGLQANLERLSGPRMRLGGDVSTLK